MPTFRKTCAFGARNPTYGGLRTLNVGGPHTLAGKIWVTERENALKRGFHYPERIWYVTNSVFPTVEPFWSNKSILGDFVRKCLLWGILAPFSQKVVVG